MHTGQEANFVAESEGGDGMKCNNYNLMWYWQSWTFGVRWNWSPGMKFIAFEFGPPHFSIEFD